MLFTCVFSLLAIVSCVDCLHICSHIYILCSVVDIVVSSGIFLIDDTNTLTDTYFLVVFCGWLFHWVFHFVLEAKNEASLTALCALGQLTLAEMTNTNT